MATGVAATSINSIGIVQNIENNIFNCVGTGISLSGKVDANINNNHFIESTRSILLTGDTLTTSISGNTFTRNDKSISFANDETLFSFTPSTFTDSVFVGIAGENRVGMPGLIAQSGILPAMPVSYKPNGHVTIQDNAQ
jgi:hypothetical protein